jgi:glycosyltransferase involved in cell wall biosynthesis
MFVSICIPTYNRPEYLKEAVHSCLSQTCKPTEILIGDDSDNNISQQLISDLQKNSSISIRYFKHRSALKQAANVNFLFNQVKTDFLMLLHDDDILVDDAIEKLTNVSSKHPCVDAFFGKQYVMDSSGIINLKASEALNKNFYRTIEYEGCKLSSLEAGFLQQFPNDGYILKTSVAKQLLYNDTMSDACDFEFGLRLGKKNSCLYFLNEYTCKYRISEIAVTTKKNYDAGLIAYKIIKALEVPKNSEIFRKKWLRLKAPVAIVQACNANNIKDALSIYFGKWHRRRILTLGGVKRLWLICKTSIFSN